jgi:hypothetical protein
VLEDIRKAYPKFAYVRYGLRLLNVVQELQEVATSPDYVSPQRAYEVALKVGWLATRVVDWYANSDGFDAALKQLCEACLETFGEAALSRCYIWRKYREEVASASTGSV